MLLLYLKKSLSSFSEVYIQVMELLLMFESVESRIVLHYPFFLNAPSLTSTK